MINRLSALDITKKGSFLFLTGYTAVYLLTRLMSLTLLPAHYDELLQLFRLDLMVGQGDLWGGLLGDEIFLLKWLQLLLIAPLLWLPPNALWIGRFVSVLAGLLGGLGCYVLALELYRRPAIGIVASLLYLISPFVLLYDRLIMPDGLLSALGVWVMIFSILVVRRPQRRWAVAAGLALVTAFLAKETGFIYLVIPLAALILLSPNKLLSKQIWTLFSIIYGLALAVVIGIVIILAVNPDILEIYLDKTGGAKVFTWQLWLHNGQTALSWLANLMTGPLLVLGVSGGVLAIVRRDRPGLFLLTIPVVVPLAFILVSDRWFPRYLLPVVPSLSLLAAWLLVICYEQLGRFNRLAARRLTILIVLSLILVAPATWYDFWLLADPARAPLPARERWQYIEDWPTTYRLAEAANYIETVALENDEIYLAVNKNSLVVLKGLDYYFDQTPNVEVVTFDAYAGHTIDSLNKWALERPTF